MEHEWAQYFLRGVGHLSIVPYYIKPPLFNWFGSVFAVLNGEVTEYTSRLPSAIAAAIGILLIYAIGKMLFGYRAALLSALIIATTPIYIVIRDWIDHRYVVLLSNRPVSGALQVPAPPERGGLSLFGE